MLAVGTTGLRRDRVDGGDTDVDHRRDGWRWLSVPAAYLLGAVPFSNLAARRVAGVDLRTVGTGTVSGSGLYAVAGFRALAVAGVLDVAKGAVGPALAGDDPARRAVAAAAGVCGHNWSPWLGGAGGRGISPAIGALLVAAPAGAATLLAGLAGGRMAGETALGSLAADAALVPVAGRAHGRDGAVIAAAVLAPLVAKRLAGNGVPERRRAYLWRLLIDADEPARPAASRRAATAPGRRPALRPHRVAR